MIRFKSDGHGYFPGLDISLDEMIAPTVPATEGGAAYYNHRLEDDKMPSVKKKEADGKPLYRVPSMSEINATPWNGLTVASTFSGCGGSCLGYRMVGYRVVWANEFVPAAQDSYEANKAEGSILDRRDIHQVTAEEVLAATGLGRGELDIFDGSPPCQAFSTAGKRHKGWGKEKSYEGGHSQLNETLFGEWLRLLRGLMPRAFVAENVSGLIKGTCKGMFLEILAEMKAAGYRVSCRVLDAQWLGVPQQRQRTIFVGVREDLVDAKGQSIQPCHPSPLPYRYSVREAIPWITGKLTDDYIGEDGNKKSRTVDNSAGTIRAGRAIAVVEPTIHRRAHGYFPGEQRSIDSPSAPVITGVNNPIVGEIRQGVERRKFSIAELRRICAFPDDFVLTGTYAQQWERLGNAVPPVMMKWIAGTIRDRILLPSKASKVPQVKKGAR